MFYIDQFNMKKYLLILALIFTSVIGFSQNPSNPVSWYEFKRSLSIGTDGRFRLPWDTISNPGGQYFPYMSPLGMLGVKGNNFYGHNGISWIRFNKTLYSSDNSVGISDLGDTIDLVSGIKYRSGLTKSNDTVYLGGNLLRATTINTQGWPFSIKSSSGDSVTVGSLGYAGTPSISSTNWLTMILKGKYLIIPVDPSLPDDEDAFPRIQIGVNRSPYPYSRNAKYAAVIESFTYSGSSGNPAVDSNRNKPFMIVTTGFNGAAGGAGDIIFRPGVTTGLGSNYDTRYGNFHVKLEPSGTGTVKTPYRQGSVTDSFMVWRNVDSSMRMVSASVAGLGDVTTAQLADTAQVLRDSIQALKDSISADILYDFGTETSVSKQLGSVINTGLIKFKTINLTATGGLSITHGTSNTDSIPINISLPDQSGQSGKVLQSDGTNASWQTPTGGITALTGDVTASGTGSVAATIAGNAVTNAKLADMATATIKGRATAGTGDPEDLTPSQARTLMNLKYSDWDMYEDFHQVLYSSFLQTFNGNGGFMFNVPIAATDQMGVARLYSGTSSAASYTALASGNDGLTFSTATMELDVKDITLGQLNTSTDSAMYIVGFFDNAGVNTDPTDGAYFVYQSGSTFWKAVTISNGVKTETITPVTAAAGIANAIDVSIRGNSTSVVFTIYGQAPITHTTNIPSGLTRTFQVGYSLKKRLGTAEQFIDVDRFLFKKDN